MCMYMHVTYVHVHVVYTCSTCTCTFSLSAWINPLLPSRSIILAWVRESYSERVHGCEEKLTVLSLSESSSETVDDSGVTGEVETAWREERGREEEGGRKRERRRMERGIWRGRVGEEKRRRGTERREKDSRRERERIT